MPPLFTVQPINFPQAPAPQPISQIPNAFDIGQRLGAQFAQSSPASIFNTAVDTFRAARKNQFETDKSRFDATVARAKQFIVNNPESPQSQALIERARQNPAFATALFGSNAKNITSQSQTQQGQQQLQSLLSGGAPPGATASVKTAFGTVNVPLNPKLTDDTKKAIAGGEIVKTSVDNAINLVQQGVLRGRGGKQSLFNAFRADFGAPIAVKGKLEDLTIELNRLKSIIPFAKGGKQLTPFESKLLFRLLNTAGKSEANIVRDIGLFRQEFDRLSELATGGAAAVKKIGAPTPIQAQRAGGELRVDANGVRAIVFPDGSFEEI